MDTMNMELDEMIPVDHFFEDYINRLRSSAAEESRNLYGQMFQPQSSDLFREREQKPSEQNPLSFAYEDFLTPMTGGNYGSQSSNNGAGVPSGGVQSADAGFYDMPGVKFDPFTNQETHGTMGPGSYLMDGDLGEPFDSKNTPISTDQGSNAGYNIGKTGKHKTVRQQQLNKLAQQRYRHVSTEDLRVKYLSRARKKAKTLGLEQTVKALTEQLSQLTSVKEEKLRLEEKNLSLEKALLEKEAELRQMKAQVESSQPSGERTADTSFDQENFLSGLESVGQDSKPAKLFHQKVRDLQKYLKYNNLDQSLLVNPLDDNLPPKVIEDIHSLVAEVCMSCMAVTRHDGPDLWSLISASLDNKQRESHDRVMWKCIAKSLKLKDSQIKDALKLREQHLSTLEKVYVQRQTLNLEAIQRLLPADQGGQAPITTPLGCFNISSFVQRLRHTSKLNNILDRLKANLSKEQKLNSELEYMTFHKVMSPLQGAWFTVSAYPHQCDSLEFLNAVHDLYGDYNQTAEGSTLDN